MSTTTALDLVRRIEYLTGVLKYSTDPVSPDQWEAFDHTLRRALAVALGGSYCNIPAAQRLALVAVSRGYPRPLAEQSIPGQSPTRAPSGARPTTAPQGRRRHLHALHENEVPDTRRPDSTPASIADPTDTHPLARLTVTVGALADLLEGRRLLPQGENHTAGPITAQLLLSADVAARHTVAFGPANAIAAPVATLTYADHHRRAFATLDWPEPTDTHIALARLRAVSPNPSPTHLSDRLEAAIDAWAKTLDAEITAAIPSNDSLRTLANQAAHIYSVSHQLLATTGKDLNTTAIAAAETALLDAAGTMRTATQAWDGLTTLARPSVQHVTTSRALFAALADGSHAIEAGNHLDRHVASHLAAANETVADGFARTTSLPRRLAESRLLFTPARRAPATLERLRARSHGALVPLQPAEGWDLSQAWLAANAAATRVAAVSRAVQPEPQTHARALFGMGGI